MTSEHLALVDAQDVADLGTFLLRARRLDVASVRLQASGCVLAVTVCTQEGHGLMGEGTVLGMRAFALAEDGACDALVAVDAVQDRLARLRADDRPGPRLLAVPPVPVVESWAGLSAPRQGWEPAEVLTREVVERVATDGIAEVAAAPSAASRDEVWHRLIPGTSIPASAALAVHALGFTGPSMPTFTHGRWRRVSSPAGHVLAR